VQLTCFGSFSSKEKNVNVGILITMAGVILKVILVFFLYHFKNEVSFKISS
jgi:hypothetical protein